MTKENILPNLYKLTIGNLSAIVAIIMGIYYFMNPGEEGWGLLIAIYLILFGMLMFAFDFFIQRFRIKYIVVNVIEILILLIIVSVFNT
ncbi:hypothetical protein L1S34_07240 [Flavobacterium sp. K77]|uniref:hypothetical protein n=1 Tax=Flavobacterium sp. K77 TaxID=2910676 RepID=UPI001F184E9E|nr:hypothetical protein [Flavobacterium sp. K77]MCF6141075.1 hypothetical protein [Flavobacterium sp. K77]